MKKTLVSYDGPTEKISIRMARAFLDKNQEQSNLFTNSEVYEDFEYVPPLSVAIDKAVEHIGRLNSLAEMTQNGGANQMTDSILKYFEALNAHNGPELSDEDKVDMLAGFLGWFDAFSFSNRGPESICWQSEQVISAYHNLGKFEFQIVNGVLKTTNKILNLPHNNSANTTPEEGDITFTSDGFDALVTRQEIFNAIDNLKEYAFKIGFLYRDAWWMEEHGQAASEYYAKVEVFKAQAKGRKDGGKATKAKAETQRDLCRTLITQAAMEKGVAFAVAGTDVMTQTIRELAQEKYADSFKAKKGKLLSVGWFRERVEYLRAGGEIVSLVEEGMEKAKHSPKST